MYIDDTFEIQIKTMFFEGWHEIEHDMRYKGEELWKNYKGFSRYFNSILATLELCDKSMVTLFEDLGHSLYKSGRWSDMIKSHFRLKLGEGQLYPEVVVQIQIRHDGGLAGIGEDELLLLKDLEHLAHRRTADMKIVGQLRIGDLFTRLHLHEDDPVVQSLEDLRLCAGHLGRVGRIRQRHGRTSR